MSRKDAPVMLLTATLSPAFSAVADNADTANASNNPLNFASGMNLLDYYTPRIYDTNVHTNDLLVRGILPIAANDFIGVPQLVQASAPISTHPDPHGGYSTGEGDLAGKSRFQQAGDRCRRRTNVGTALARRRSTATWTFDLRNDTHYIPLGFGGGKVWKSGDNVLNAFIEPQWTVERSGNGQPQFTLLAGLNVTFGK